MCVIDKWLSLKRQEVGCHLFSLLSIFIFGKKRKRDSEDLISKIAKIDEEAEKKAEGREKRWLESEDRREEGI